MFADLAMVASIGVLVWMLAACGEQTASTPVPSDVVVESGVTVIPPVDGADPAGEESTEALLEPLEGLPEAATTPDIFVIGSEVQARGMLRLYGAPEPTAITLAEYGAGERFTVMEAPSNAGAYPVELNGVFWYRVRAGDGLVGWVIADGIEPVAE